MAFRELELGLMVFALYPHTITAWNYNQGSSPLIFSYLRVEGGSIKSV